MNKENDILTKVFHDRLKNYELPVDESDTVWAAIEKDLRKPKSVFYMPWARIALLSGAAVLAILIYLKFWTKENHNIAEPAMPTIASIIHQKKDLQVKKENILAYAHNKTIVASTDIHKKESQIITEEESILEDVGIESIAIQEESTHISKQNRGIDSPQKNAYSCLKKKKRNKDFSFSLAMRNSGTLSPNAEKTTNYIVNTGFVNNSKDMIESDAQYSAKANTIVMDTKYSLPVSMGFAVRKRLVDSWALESGLVYTHLSTTETLTGDLSDLGNAGSLFQDRKTELHYIGIPLKVVYSFYNSDKISLYSTAGGMGEFCVYGKEKANNESTQLDIPEIQWSVFAGAGINYKIINKLSLFIEPEVVYYFDDKSEVKTIRKSVPFNINLQAGLRLEY